MRLANQLSRFRRHAAKSCRYSSSYEGPTYTLSNLRAFPFAITPEEAIVQLGPFASSYSLNGIIGSLGARYLPGFGFKPLIPSRIQAAYYPGWVVDVEAEMQLSTGEDRATPTGSVLNAYLPGSNYPVLSNTCILPRNAPTHSWSSDLLSQHNMDIACIPYSITPFSVLEIAKNTWRRIEIEEDSSFSPSTLKPKFLAVYPILIPLYIAQYSRDPDDLERSITLVVEAATPKGRIFGENVAMQTKRQLDRYGIQSEFLDRLGKAAYDMAGEVQVFNGLDSDYIQLQEAHIPGGKSNSLNSLASWANDIMRQPETLDALVEHSDVSKLERDPRVRPLTTEELTANHTYLALGSEITLTRRISEVIASAEIETGSDEPVNVIGVNLSGGRIHREKMNTKILQSRIQELEAKREEAKPDWWKAWETSQGDRS